MAGNHNVRYIPARQQAGVFRLPSSNPFVEDYWPPGKVADNQNK
ncbi:hypothetical protein [Aquiflexum sp. TKW24L]|nr:hypothetical protein [Aquiflexum sp. TKW24L]